ncbi:PREDICTED: uncharacterized protein LOC106749193 [Dinoponera quadriceps]|uniref:Uncharacterized protein LOC106749193 n=1 Tax=Dinoponera quadriceps TaxID=609295 RepID=A0A6P3XZA5_DINQU|nr:PREDICTED: uncharacterized protein LOC106749193 [Dinoponera quadriceps]
MACYKVYLALSALIACHVTDALYELERLKAQLQYRDVSRAPWNNRYDSYETASSEVLPHYYDTSYVSSEDRHGSSSERFPISGIKKEPNEDKGFKKTTSPFGKDSLKELALNSRTAHCQEIKVKSVGAQGEPPKGVTTCYRCKDPKTKSSYERCLYKSEPEESSSASTKMERFLSTPVNFRYRRSSAIKEDRPRNPYRFADEYFTDATHNVPIAYENKGEKCEKIVKDSMVCMVCKDTKTNGKYEQCSYVKNPREKAYSYTKSSTFGKQPQEQKNEGNAEKGSYSSGTRVSERRDPAEPREYSHSSELRSEKTAKEQDEVQEAPTTGCKQVQKDSKSCTVCKDSKTGGTYEKCTYSYQPSDKLYKYSRSNSFGYPDKSSSQDADKASYESKNSDSTHEDTYFGGPTSYSDEKSAEDESEGSSGSSPYSSSPYYSSYSEGSSAAPYEGGATSDREKSASERHAENIDSNHCREVQKDSMTCTVCKDPKSGNDFEQCSYSYRPSDKLFSYSQSSSFGSPRESEESSQKQESEHEEERPDGSESPKGSYEPYAPGLSYEASTKDEAKSEDSKGREAVDAAYLHTAKKKAEIEGFLQNFRKKDRSKCKKVMRDKMTCYQCIDDEGFQKEECVFVTGQEPDKEQLAFHEIKEFQMDPASSLASSTKPKTADPPLQEPIVSASKNSYVRLEKPDNEYPDEASQTAEETKEAEPYDYTSETRARYDKVLGMTLPAYMFTTSEHEAAFDEVVASSHQNER